MLVSELICWTSPRPLVVLHLRDRILLMIFNLYVAIRVQASSQQNKVEQLLDHIPVATPIFFDDMALSRSSTIDFRQPHCPSKWCYSLAKAASGPTPYLHQGGGPLALADAIQSGCASKTPSWATLTRSLRGAVSSPLHVPGHFMTCSTTN